MIVSDVLLLEFSLVFFFLLVFVFFLVNSSTPIFLLLDGRPFPRITGGFLISGVTFELLNCCWSTFSTSETNTLLKEV